MVDPRFTSLGKIGIDVIEFEVTQRRRLVEIKHGVHGRANIEQATGGQQFRIRLHNMPCRQTDQGSFRATEQVKVWMERKTIRQGLRASVLDGIGDSYTGSVESIGQGETAGERKRGEVGAIRVHLDKGSDRGALCRGARLLIVPGAIVDQAMNQRALRAWNIRKGIALALIAIVLIAHAIGKRPEHENPGVSALLEFLLLTIDQFMFASPEAIQVAPQVGRNTDQQV